MNEVNAKLTTCRLEPVWFVRVEPADRDDARVRDAVTTAVGLDYGAFDGVAFEGAAGIQFFRPRDGTQVGAREKAIEMPVRVLRFSVPQDAEALARAIESIRDAHSYEEPVIGITEG